ncbi:AraC family transcriptional regulator [Entomospira culicis]|uniref:AraC family transcriptional regulator n=1 Tax=Entomospira culicis TaxID=2719989 RepID=A0A968KUZ4_9SPIO|nr:helix-turn-helix domain-containing protein [Entomospira culicis]NIZ19460.1 AraC family transcriptional regulator [Entomospira culicis]NIZ69635.1 AraC family transcriptional regulator [Entomospira culicis]WDI36746.1 AraC family transcriptional regulator [Entomospira culicis]WDI38375.1 AraC family transcriptional regulator [Entomospira culicis]
MASNIERIREAVAPDKQESRVYDPIISLARQYHPATGVSVRVFDNEVHEIYRVDHPSWGCQFCQHMRLGVQQKSSAEYQPKEHCATTHVFGAVRSRQLSGHYVYQCRSGFTFWSSPIIINGRFLASVVAGSTMLMNREEFIKRAPKYHQGRLVDTLGVQLLEQVESTSETRVVALAEILHLSCSALSQKHSHMMFRGAGRTQDRDLVFNAEFKMYEELLVLVESGSTHEAKDLAVTIFQKIDEAMESDFFRLKEQILDLAIFLTNATNVQGSGDFSLNVQFLRDLQMIMTTEDLREWLLSVIEMVSSIPTRVSQLKYGHLLVHAVRYMHQNFSKNITLEEVSKIAKLSPSYFSRLFKTEMGLSFTEYLNRIRINESKRKLKFTNLTLFEIANICGFSDQSYFTKIFKRAEGISPGRYRQSQKNDGSI